MPGTVQGRDVLLIGHADGDGYLATEVSRRNALGAGARHCEVLIDPKVTGGYRIWDRYLDRIDLGAADMVIFVDLMLSYRDPRDSFDRLAALARREPARHFVLIDHHPVEGLPTPPDNLELRFTNRVYDCCWGDPDNEADMMLVASICDRDEAPVRDRITEVHRRRAVGLSRAAADRSMLAGEPLRRLVETGAWELIEGIADEDRAMHRTVRGLRPKADPRSPAVLAAQRAAVA